LKLVLQLHAKIALKLRLPIWEKLRNEMRKLHLLLLCCRGSNISW